MMPARFPRWPVIVVLLSLLPGAPSPDAGDSGAGDSPAPTAATSLPLSSFSAIHSATVGDYVTYQFKVTYLGPQLKTTRSLFGVGTGRTFSLAAFVPYQRNFSYANDGAGGTPMILTAAEFKAFVDGIGTHPTLTDNTLRANPNLSLMILRGTSGSTRCWEHLCPTMAQSDTLFTILHDVLPDSTRKVTIDHFRHMMAGVRR